MINVFTDGGSRGNPGQSAIGVYIIDKNNNVLSSFGKTIGVATNNTAEYTAVIEALNFISENKELFNKEESINFYLDSELVVSQINGLYKMKNPNLRMLLFKIREKEAEINCIIKYFHIPREKNKQADKLVNTALDNL